MRCVICGIRDWICLKSGVTLETVKFRCGSCQLMIKLAVHEAETKVCKFAYKRSILHKIALHIVCTLVNLFTLFFFK
jgi:hypothetical protein